MTNKIQNVFDIGNRVLTPGGIGTVLYKRMMAPEYINVEAYSIKLDNIDTPGYTGTIYPANKVKSLIGATFTEIFSSGVEVGIHE